jgi:hypothetical protein
MLKPFSLKTKTATGIVKADDVEVGIINVPYEDSVESREYYHDTVRTETDYVTADDQIVGEIVFSHRDIVCGGTSEGGTKTIEVSGVVTCEQNIGTYTLTLEDEYAPAIKPPPPPPPPEGKAWLLLIPLAIIGIGLIFIVKRKRKG